jgi:predicted dehydrogenase
MSESKRLRIGIIGIGGYAFNNYIPAIKASSRAELVAISRRTPAALACMKELTGAPEAYTDWRELLDRARPDAVIVSTAHAAHAAPTIAALERGLPVLVDKPLAATSADAWAMVQAAERAARLLMVGYQRRSYGLYRAVKRLLAEGAVGAIEQVNVAFGGGIRWLFEADSVPAPALEAQRQRGLGAVYGDGRLEGYWRRDPAQLGGGHMADTGSHFADLALWMAGSPPVSVVALTHPAGQPVERCAGVVAHLANGVLVTLSANNNVPMNPQLTVLGDKGTLSGEPEGKNALGLWLRKGSEQQQVTTGEANMPHLEAFLAAVLDGAPNPCSPREGAHAVELIEAAYRSAAEGRAITIESPQ